MLLSLLDPAPSWPREELLEKRMQNEHIGNGNLGNGVAVQKQGRVTSKLMKHKMMMRGLETHLVPERLWSIVGSCKGLHDAALQRKPERCW